MISLLHGFVDELLLERKSDANILRQLFASIGFQWHSSFGVALIKPKPLLQSRGALSFVSGFHSLIAEWALELQSYFRIFGFRFVRTYILIGVGGVGNGIVINIG